MTFNDADGNDKEYFNSKSSSIVITSDNPSAKEEYNLDGSSQSSQDLSQNNISENEVIIEKENKTPGTTSGRPKFLKDIILVYLFYSIYILGAFVYSFFIPNMLQEYVRAKNPEFTQEEVLSLASHYKSFSDAAPYLSTFLFGPLFGVLSDKFGRKKIFWIVIITQAFDLSTALISYKLKNLVYFYVGHTLFSIPGIIGPTVLSYVADITTKEERPKIYAMAGAPMGLGVVLGPLAGVACLKISITTPLYFAYLVLVIVSILCVFLKESTDLKSEQERELLKKQKKIINPFVLIKKLFSQSKYVIYVTLLYITFSFCSADLNSTYFMYTQIRYNWSPTYNGYYISFLGVMVIFYSGFIIPHVVLKRFSDRKTISFAFLMSTLVHFAYGLAVNQYIWIGCLIFGGFTSVILNLTQALISKSTPPEIQGSILTGVASAGSIASFLGTLITQNIFAYFISNRAPTYLPGSRIYLPGTHFLIDGFIVFLTFCASLLIWKYYPNQFGKNAITKKSTPEEEEKLLVN